MARPWDGRIHLSVPLVAHRQQSSVEDLISWQGHDLTRECVWHRDEAGLPRVTFRRRAGPGRRSSMGLASQYSLERSRTLKAAPSKAGKRVSSGPTGMYTEHIHWARTMTKQPSSAARAGAGRALAEGKQPTSPAADTYPILSWTA